MSTTPLPTGIAFRWKASDLNSSPISDWVDEIQSYHWTASGSARPSWDANGVAFNGTANSLAITNISTGNSQSWLVVLKPNTATAGKMVLCNAFGGGAIFLGYNSSACLYDGTGLGTDICGGGTAVFDFFEGKTTNSTAYIASTNGVMAWNQAQSWNGGVPLLFVGSGAGNAFWNGVIKEVIVWTNQTFTAANLAAIHNYATNTYSFSP